PTKSIYQFFSAAGAGQSLSIAATDDNSWNQQVIAGGLPTQYHNAYEDPTVKAVSPATSVSASFFSVPANNSTPTLVGTFTLASNWVLTFNTNSASVVVTAPHLTLSRIGNTSSISFVSSNGVSYSLCCTNTAGLIAPLSTWPTMGSPISGD